MQKLLDLLKQPLHSGGKAQKISLWLALVGLIGSIFVGVLLKNSTGTTYVFTAEEVTRSNNATGLALDVFLKLGVVVALIGLSAIVARKWMGGGAWKPAERKMVVQETLNLSPHRALHLVRVDGQVLLIGATDHAVQLLKEINPRVEEKALEQEGTEFSELFKVSMDQFEPLSKGQG